MRIRTPTTSAEAVLLNAVLGRHRGREPERAREVGQPDRQVRLEGVPPYLLEGPLPPNHLLADRLRQIFRKYPESVNPIVGKKKQARADFIEKVVATRNYRTHFNEELESRAARVEELYPITEKLKHLIEICLLGEIGFEAERIRGLIK